MSWPTEDPGALLKELWRKMARATADHRSPWRTPVVATESDWGPEARIVVLRKVDREARRLCFHTDARSHKLPQLRARPRLTWLFWDPRSSVQLRVKSRVRLHQRDELARAHWEKQSESARALFEKPGDPGEPLEDPSPPDSAFDVFVWVETVALHFDWLWLTQPEHLRFHFDLEASQVQRVVP